MSTGVDTRTSRCGMHFTAKWLVVSGFAALSICGLAASASANVISAPVPVSTSYTISLPNYAVTNIVIVNEGSPFTTIAQGPANAPLSAGTPGPTTLTQTYLTANQLNQPGFVYQPGSSFLLGVATNLIGDASGQQHLVVFTNTAFAASATSIAFGTLFPNSNETTLINDLITQTNPGDISSFASGDAANGPNGSITFSPGSSFSAVAFSGGQTIGTGISFNNFAPVSVPEPASLALMLSGLVWVGAVLRTTRRPATASA